MNKLLAVLTMVFGMTLVNAQAYEGQGDVKFQIGANIQENGTGITISYDSGIAENFSIGLSSSYILGIEEHIGADFGARIDLKARFNANIGSVFQLDDNIDIYPGLNLSLKNFGGHLGVRYFFSDGFGLFAEANAPLARYKSKNLTLAEELHNQFAVNLGVTFNL